MHRLAAVAGGWNPDDEGVVFIEQTPAPIVVLTAADTDIQTLAMAVSQLPKGFPGIRVTNLLNLQQNLTIDTYAEEVLAHAQVMIVRLLGGRSYWSYGLEVVQELSQRTGAALFVLPGDDRPDLNLFSHSTVALSSVNQLWRYLTEGGVGNVANALRFVADTCLGTNYGALLPQVIPDVGRYDWQETTKTRRHQDFSYPKIGLLFYRAHYLAGNVAAIDALCQALAVRGLEPVPVFVSSLRDPDVQAEVLEYFQPKDQPAVEVVLNTTSFAISQLADRRHGDTGTRGHGDTETVQLTESPRLPLTASPSSLLPPPSSLLTPPSLWHTLNVPVLQVIFSGGTVEQWRSQFRGLSPRDMAMNVALPEVDGRIITRAVSFKAVQTRNAALETDVVSYQPVGDRIQFVADLAANWVRLRQTPVEERKIALILANYPTRDGRLANGVGLDTPTSCIEILKALQPAGYRVENPPETGDELMQRLIKGVTNDPEGRELRSVHQSVSGEEYQQYFATLPDAVQQGVCQRWGSMAADFGTDEADNPVDSRHRSSVSSVDQSVAISGIQLGNIFVGIQPARGYDRDPTLNYHAPDLEPTHEYLAFYYWVRQHFQAQAIAHIGKHGNLEWLPGKGIALSESCYPEVALGALPHLYPFIVNDPGEGAQAKRRSHAVILDHLTPPMTRAELYGPLQQLEALIDEYYEAQNLDPSRLATIRDRIINLIQQENLHQDLGMTNDEWRMTNEENLAILNSQFSILNSIDGYLCELKEAQIRDGLHIFGQCPQGRQLRDLIVAIARQPGSGRLGITRAIAQDLKLDFDPLTADFGLQIADCRLQTVETLQSKISNLNSSTPLHTIGDVVQRLEEHAAELVEQFLQNPNSPIQTLQSKIPNLKSPIPHTHTELTWITTHLLPALQQTSQELTNLLRGFDGQYIPSGPAGAPTRGRPEVLPTGRNFYSVDIRAIPTETAWDVGRKAAEAMIERYTQENGEYPKTLGLSVWGTSTMRTGGDDIAEALALLGVQPVWEGTARRVIDFEILPLSILGRPRVDVTLRISGFFRDAFANLIELCDRAITAVAALDEPPNQNPLAAQVRQETQYWQAQGLTREQAEGRSRYRIFGSKPGAYGAGLQGLIESQNWTDDADLARAYINWSSYAYTASPFSQGGLGGISQRGVGGISAPEAFEQRLQQMQVVLHNQDNREHDLLDSDDYYQFQGGLTAAVRVIRGENPQTYFGDHSRPENPRVRRLQEEIARVYRSRVVNPKWIAGVMRHGYKGAFEMAATVDYLFAYDATAHCVEDFMYQGVAEAYLFNPSVQEFVQQKNPWALRDMAERLLEAHQRGLWQDVQAETLEKLRAIALQAEGSIESL
ncbi:MAG: cobaltochelatase subunit CobN [Leptolyngbyaceae cyanobacterium RU_5_1]|nr:cobaltochelatase subunit CobN [Leptolyngbyaceae cyanobacterium RU_5_1]